MPQILGDPIVMNRNNILVCDDSLANVMLLSRLIEKQMNNSSTTPITDPLEVIPALNKQDYDLLLLDLEMPEMRGSELLKLIRQHWSMEQLPVIIITGTQDTDTRNECLSSGANDFMNKPFNEIEVCLRIKNTLQVKHANGALAEHNSLLDKKVKARTAELDNAMDFLVHCLGSVGEFRDSETGRHVLRVGKYSRLLAEAYGLPDDLVFMIEKAAPLHDIGKVGIPDNVLLKPAKLDGTEWDKMRKHVDYGYKILNGSRSNVIRMAQSIAISHHERWDGEGYPRQLKGEAIPIEGRITAIADVFDALVSKRPYKDAWVISDALANLKEQSGKAFDPTLIQLFMDNLDEIASIYHKYSD